MFMAVDVGAEMELGVGVKFGGRREKWAQTKQPRLESAQSR
jgi:hypothetical protein